MSGRTGKRERGKTVPNRLKALLEAAKTAKPSAEHLEQHRRSFVFGNTALENELITREMVDRQAERIAREIRAPLEQPQKPNGSNSP
jgi:hypothetical protein